MPIQTEVGISIELDMGPIPIDNLGCYVKYTFPNDMPLPAGVLGGYQSSALGGYQMMYSSTNGINLKRDIEYFIDQQAFAPAGGGNYIILKGCTQPTVVGTNEKAKVKFTGVTTPSAQKTTGTFKVEVYKNFSPSPSYQLSDLMASVEGSIDKSEFTSGQVTAGTFAGTTRTVQERSQHSLQFKIQNSLPAKNSEFDSRVVIQMPARLTKDATFAPTVKNLDGSVLNAALAYETAYPGCTGTVVCYSITHANLHDVPAGSTLRFRISGTVNQEAVQSAGTWAAQTQIRSIATGEYFNIDYGQFDAADFVTTQGGIGLPSGRFMASSSLQNYFFPAVYTLYFTLNEYIPLDGVLKVDLPPQIEIQSDPFAQFKCSDANLRATGTYSARSLEFKASGGVV